MEQRGYNLLTINEYQELLKDYGFVNYSLFIIVYIILVYIVLALIKVNIKAEDKTDFFIEYSNKELNNFIQNKDEFIKV